MNTRNQFVDEQANWGKLGAVMLSILLIQCKSQSQAGCIALDSASASPTTLEIVSENLESALGVILTDPEEQQMWQQEADLYSPEQGGWAGWLTELKVEPSLELSTDRYLLNPVRLSTGEEKHGYLLVKNFWQLPHSLRVIFFLDFQQMSVMQMGQIHGFYDMPEMQPQEERAVEFVLPELPVGFHQLSYVLVADPESVSTDQGYRVAQQSSFQEHRYDLWVGIAAPSENVPVFEDMEVGEAAISRVGDMDLVLSAASETNEALQSLRMISGETRCLPLRLYNCGVECRKEKLFQHKCISQRCNL